MNFNKTIIPILVAGMLGFLSSCKDGNSVYDPDYEPSRPDPVITSISPQGSYLAGVDSVIITGENFASSADSMTVNFGGSEGIIKSISGNSMVVRPGSKVGEDIGVRVSVRGAEFFSNSFTYTLEDPFNFYFGLTAEDTPTSDLGVDDNDNIYTIINRGGIIRYTRIGPDGTVTKDQVKYPGEPRPNPNDDSSYPTDSTMRFTSYTSLQVDGNGQMYMAQQGLRAVFTKKFGDDVREEVWLVSSSSALKVQDFLFDQNNHVWVVGLGSNNIHRFDHGLPRASNEVKFPFEGDLNAVALYDGALYVGGKVGGVSQVWKLPIDGSGNLGTAELYFDYGQHYDGTIKSMIFAENGELLIADQSERSIVRVFPGGSHESLYPGMLKGGAYSITWRSDKYAVVALTGEDAGINFLNMYDRLRAGIYGF